MNFTQLITEVQKVALRQHNVNSFSSEDVYEYWNRPHTQYASVNIGLESADRTENTIVYNCVLYYGDRLLQNASNKIAIQDDAVKVLQGIISNLPDEITYYTPINYTVFEQEFADYIAGAYCRVRLETEFDQGNCSLDDYIEELKTLYVTENGIFNVAGYDQVEVHVEGSAPIVLEELIATENGTYTPDPNIGGYSKVYVNVVDEEAQRQIEELNKEVVELQDIIVIKDEEINAKDAEISTLNEEINTNRPIVLSQNGTTTVQGLGYNDITVNVPSAKPSESIVFYEKTEEPSYFNTLIYVANTKQYRIFEADDYLFVDRTANELKTGSATMKTKYGTFTISSIYPDSRLSSYVQRFQHYCENGEIIEARFSVKLSFIDQYVGQASYIMEYTYNDNKLYIDNLLEHTTTIVNDPGLEEYEYNGIKFVINCLYSSPRMSLYFTENMYELEEIPYMHRADCFRNGADMSSDNTVTFNGLFGNYLNNRSIGLSLLQSHSVKLFDLNGVQRVYFRE